ncbi:calcium/sodium antiporter [Methanobacterium alcaliphilum]|uniref:calcium/sodium antiporter n=1 Tax=Methanobacterium alcaliphilum TaxID=392018 RepID=UPI00200A875C|nr:calcium/sodium antiporter [Methanobacterium alcaliphilum]MCK9152519.1 calcium/sodium antiporter [Methanobacterium alcaliphilum]
MLWLILLIILIISIIIVIKSADVFVENLVDIGSSFGISEVVLGVTAAAMGTSLPEFGSAMIAILSGSPDVGVGCAIGANIWNIGGILGISALVAGTIPTNKISLKRDGVMALFTGIIIFGFLYYYNEVNFFAALVLIAAYLVYLIYLIRSQKKNINKDIILESENNFPEPTKTTKKFNIQKKLLLLVLGLLGLGIGCRIIVYCTVELSIIFTIPEMLAGILLAFGTTAPEFFTVLTSARRGLNNLAIGTVFGSNIFNILIGLGIPALIVTIPVESIAINYDAPFMIVITAALLVLLRRGFKLSRGDGLILIAFYGFYIMYRTSMVV